MNDHDARTVPVGLGTVGLDGRVLLSTVASRTVAYGTPRSHHGPAVDDMAVPPNRLFNGEASRHPDTAHVALPSE
jgi:hypothetical protein